MKGGAWLQPRKGIGSLRTLGRPMLSISSSSGRAAAAVWGENLQRTRLGVVAITAVAAIVTT